MRNYVLFGAGFGLLCLTLAQGAVLALDASRGAALAGPAELLQGCTDVPEAVALADTLKERALRIERYREELDRKKAEIAEAQAQLTTTLADLKAAQDKSRSKVSTASAQVNDDVQRMIAVYDEMKPAQAGQILASLPPDFAAEILMRVQPETGAKIMASVEPGQAALFTSYMGARSVGKTRN